jgi:L-alanine-DL-glutamate epimerase-like enolase superfamily enzyme
VRIARIDVFAVRYTLEGGSFEMSGGRVAEDETSTVVRVQSDDGLTGWGEQCVIHPGYAAGLAQSAQAALRMLGRAVLGLDPRQVEVIHARMDADMQGYRYAKSALDIACWDLLGQAAGLRTADLLGGVHSEEIELYTAIGMAAPAAMADACRRDRAAGYRHAQIKVGGNWREDVARIEACADALAGEGLMIVDANGGWTQLDAIRVLSATADVDLLVEQPCRTLAQCAAVRSAVARPMILDESLVTVEDLVRAHAAGAVDAVRLKLSRSGGITPVRRMRDLATELGLPVMIEDAGGGAVVDAAVTHMAGSTPRDLLLCGHLPGSMASERIATGAPIAQGGHTRVPEGPGLGLEVDERKLGAAVLTVG